MGLGRNTWLKSGDAAQSSAHTSRPQSIALVCDWLTTPGGAEKVLLELHKMYPTAPIYTSQYRPKSIDWFGSAKVKTGWLNFFPASLRKFLSPLRQLYFSHLDLTEYDLVISVTGAEAKSVKAKNHLCYCHAPTQYYWQMYDKYLKNPGFGFLDPLVRFFFRLLVTPLRKADFAAAQLPTQFVTISTYSAAQIKQYYHRDTVIVAPPVDTKVFSVKKHQKSTQSPQFSTKISDFSTGYPQKPHTFPQVFHKQSQGFPQYVYQSNNPSKSPKIICPYPPAYFIIACRQVTWKRVDLAISACKKLNLPLLVVGDGPEREHLLELAEGSEFIKFLPWSETRELAEYLRGARAYIFPSLEPFGIAAVEALAAGCPVIAYTEGGSRDFVAPGKNGLLFSEQTVSSLASALKKFPKYHFDPIVVSKTAEPFATSVFRQKIRHLVSATLTNSRPKPRRARHA